jgi:hypothetical protein
MRVQQEADRNTGPISEWRVIWAQAGSNTYTDRLHSVQRSIASPVALSNYLALGVFSNHLQPSDLKGFEFDGADNDKRDETDIASPTLFANVAKQFANLLSYSRALPARLPDFYNYLLSFPNGKPTDAEDTFYWEK